jgi:hypothetical protein
MPERSDVEQRADVIRHENGKWVLYSHDGSKKLGEHDTEEAAKKQEAAIRSVKRYDVGELKATKLDNGYLVADARITRVGVFDYMNPDGTRRRELRMPEEVFKADALASFHMMPLTNQHPPEALDAKNTRKYQVGTVGEVRADGAFVSAKLLVTDEDAIAAAEKGRRELSCGYSCDLEARGGVTQGIAGVQDGLRYDAVQRNIRGNHVALVNRGRAGSEVSMRLDSTDAVMLQVEESKQEPPGDHRMKTVKIDGVDFEVSEQAYQAFTKALAKSDADGESLIRERDEAVEKLSKEKARADKAEEDLAKEQKLRADSASPATIAKIVRARVELVQTSEKILGEKHGLKLDEMSDDEVRKAVVLKVSPEAKAKVEAGDATYLAARFDAAVEGVKVETKEDGLAAVRSIRPIPGREERKDSGDARKAMLERNMKLGRDAIGK